MDLLLESAEHGGQGPGAENVRNPDKLVNQTTGPEDVVLGDQRRQLGPGFLDLGRKGLERPCQQRPAIDLAQLAQCIGVEFLT